MQRLKLSSVLEFVRGGIGGNGTAGPVELITARNRSGGTLTRGDVVIWDVANTTVNEYAFTTTTAQNNVRVMGMVYDTSVADGAVCRIQIFGPTKFLKVNGTTDIAIGDMLGTFTAAGIASVTTTAGRFAMACEAYATNDSAGVIDAIILNRNTGAFTTE